MDVKRVNGLPDGAPYPDPDDLLFNEDDRKLYVLREGAYVAVPAAEGGGGGGDLLCVRCGVDGGGDIQVDAWTRVGGVDGPHVEMPESGLPVVLANVIPAGYRPWPAGVGSAWGFLQSSDAMASVEVVVSTWPNVTVRCTAYNVEGDMVYVPVYVPLVPVA